MAKEKREKILLINLGGIGDVLLSTPALRALRNLYTGAEIDMLVTPSVHEMTKKLSYVDKVFALDIGNGAAMYLKRLLKNLLVLSAMRKEKYDLAINMRTLVSRKSARKIKFLLSLINPRKTLGRNTEGRGVFFDLKVPEPDIGQVSEIEYDLDTVKALGAEVYDRSVDIEIDEESVEEVQGILKMNGIDNEDIVVGIHPGGAPSHRWGTQNFSEFIDRTYSKVQCKFVITGGKSEVALATELQNGIDTRAINLAGQLDIAGLCAFIQRCDLYVTNDTGPMHIAAALKIPMVAIFGPGYLDRFDPRNISDKAMVMYKKKDCAPCNKVKCDSMDCLKTISSEEVAEVSLNLLSAETTKGMR